ncbi:MULTISPECIES: amidohydrolase family protein [Curtobacterium]|uniref:amidohydrolase n=1 Tax=Curtobacterium flaccumfaciens TaxID=2035 RepID=UPI003EE4DADF
MHATLFENGSVRPGAGHPDLSALLVVDGVVQPQGTTPPDGTRRIDLAGGLLLPAFREGHAHPLLAGRETAGPRLRDATTPAEVAARAAAWASQDRSPWLVGGSYDATIAPDGMFDARWLDAVVPDRPVLLHAWDYHTAWVNSAALRAAGVDADTPDPALGVIARRPDGTPLGTLVERPAIDLVLGAAPAPSLQADVDALRWATGRLAARGFAWVQEAWAETADVPAWIAAARSGALAVDADLALRADPRRWPDQLDEIVATAATVADAPGLTARTVKFFVDGIIETRTAHLLAEYHDACTHGLPNWRSEDLVPAVTAVAAAGFDVHLHAIGDGAVRSALDAVAALRAAGSAARATIAHAQVIDERDLGRLADLDVTICFQPQWAVLDDVMTDLTLPRLGPDRALQYRMRSALDAGARISFGSDWPVAEPDPLEGIRSAVTRQDTAGEPADGWQPLERITIDEALDAATSGVAYQAGDERRRGTLAPGAVADLVWLDRDVRTIPPSEIGDVRVLGTWRAGLPTTPPQHSLLDSPDRSPTCPQRTAH